MAEQNIKMNVKTDTGYDTLYPQTKADIVSFNDTQSVVKGKTVQENLKNTANALYRPNLLINGDFQCNQRGQSEYSFGKYGIDMWYVNSDKYFWTQDGLVFANIWQKVPLLKGTNYVLTYQIDKQNVQKHIIIKALNTEYTDGYLKVKLETDGTYTKVRLAKNNPSNFDRINFVQLTEGDVAYPHVKEDYDTALRRCKKYLQVITNGGKYNSVPCMFIKRTNTTLESSVDLGMAGSASVKFSGNYALVARDGSVQVKVKNGWYDNGAYLFYLELDRETYVNGVCRLQSDADAIFIMSCEPL